MVFRLQPTPKIKGKQSLKQTLHVRIKVYSATLMCLGWEQFTYKDNGRMWRTAAYQLQISSIPACKSAYIAGKSTTLMTRIHRWILFRFCFQHCFQCLTKQLTYSLGSFICKKEIMLRQCFIIIRHCIMIIEILLTFLHPCCLIVVLALKHQLT